MKKTYQLAFCGISAGLAIVLMSLGTLIPAATYCCPVLAILLMIPVLDLVGGRYALIWYAAVAILSFFLVQDREAALCFIVFGIYPVVRIQIGRIRNRAFRFLLKELYYCFAAGLLALGVKLLCAAEAEAALWMLLLYLVLGNAVFLLADLLLERFTRLWTGRWKHRFIR